MSIARIDPFRLVPSVGPGADPHDGFWRLHDLRASRQEPFAMSLLRTRLIDIVGSSCVIRMTDEQALAGIGLMIQGGWLKPIGQEETRHQSSTLPQEKEAPPPRPAAAKPKLPPPPPPLASATVSSYGPAATARIEAAQTGVALWECCEACGF